MDPLNSDSTQSSTRSVILAILDGWGLAPSGNGNAISTANTPNMDKLWASFPHTQLQASGDAVGLPRGEVGNTETGHLNIAAGKIVYQDLARINMSIADGTFFKNKTLLDAADHVVKNQSALHLIGLIGAGGVHSNLEHLFSIIHFASLRQLKNVYFHLITDGRDSPPTSSRIYISQIRNVLQKEGVGKFASLMGRYWAMDRDKRWERTLKAYRALTLGEGNLYKTPEEVIDDSYSSGKTDEFIEPALMMGPDGGPIALVKDNDSVIFTNFRVDRPRQLSRAFVFDDEKDIVGIDLVKDRSVVKRVENAETGFIFNRGKKKNNLFFCTMTEYEKALTNFGAKPVFPPIVIDMPIGSVISHQNMKQLRAAESEKERFVTYYFNGQRDLTYPGEDHLIVPSPKVTTYDKEPEMSAVELTDKILDRITKDNYSLVVINYANVDMVGHTGDFNAAVKAVETVDKCIGRLYQHVISYGGTLVVTADHGNAEEMVKPDTGEIITEHTDNPVPFIVASKKHLLKSVTLPAGILGDIAPTILSILDIPVPSSMMGRNLLEQIDRNY